MYKLNDIEAWREHQECRQLSGIDPASHAEIRTLLNARGTLDIDQATARLGCTPEYLKHLVRSGRVRVKEFRRGDGYVVADLESLEREGYMAAGRFVQKFD